MAYNKIMKNFWTKLNLRTKIMFGFFGFVIILSAIGWLTYKKPESTINTTDNTDFVNKITNRNPILSYPVSYSTLWDGKITLLPKNVRDLEYAVSTTDQCSGIVKGMDVYYTTDVVSLMIVTNKNLQISPSEVDNYNSAKDIITGIKNFDNSNAELKTFQTYCSYFSLYKIDELNIKYPNTDYSRSIWGIGLRQGSVNNIAQVGIYLNVYAAKDDYLIEVSKSLQGSFLFSQANWDICKTKSLQSDQNMCLAGIYSNDLSLKAKVESEITNLLKTFELSNEGQK